MTGAQLVSQHVMAKIKLLCNTFSECFTDNLTNSFHILMQRFVLFFLSARPTNRQLIVSLLFPVLGVALTKWNFPNNHTHKLCGGLCCHGRIKQTRLLWKWHVTLSPCRDGVFRKLKKFSQVLLTIWLGEQSSLLWTKALCLHLIPNQAKLNKFTVEVVKCFYNSNGAE
jgi:hypothetical protein